MEKMGDWEQKNLIAELRLGRELARQLQIHLKVPCSSRETREMLLQKIVVSYEKSLSIINFNNSGSQYPTGSAAIPMSESPASLSGSPGSEDYDIKDHDDLNGFKKRKIMPSWTQQVRVDPGMGLEGPLDDGFSWRKYGQKYILGTKYPRGYYRCTHRNVQGCLATKQVQRSDKDPAIFEINYRGRHSCHQATHTLSPSYQPLENELPIKNIIFEPQRDNPQVQVNQQEQSQELLMNLSNSLKFFAEDFDSVIEQSNPSFPSTTTLKPETPMFSPSMADNSFMGNLSPSLISPSTSGINHFSISSSGVHRSFGGDENFREDLGSELKDIISAETSATESPTVGFDFPFVNDEFDLNFIFNNNPGFLS